MAMSGCSDSAGVVTSWQEKDHAVEITLTDGTLTLIPQSRNVIRVQFTQPGSRPTEELIFIEKTAAPEYKTEVTRRNIIVKTDKISAVVNRKSGAITFKDAQGNIILQEQVGGRKMTPSTVQGDSTFIVEQRFVSPEDEYLYGTGQFQDNYLNIRGLPRQLRQVNTQISIPFILSNKSYGLLWHNYGLVDFNPADEQIPLQPMDEQKVKDAEETLKTQVTKTVSDYVLPLHGFTATVDIPESGEYAFVLDLIYSGHKCYLNVDGHALIDNNSPWIPPRTPIITSLAAGQHHIEIISERGVKSPRLFVKPMTDETVFRSPVAQALDYAVFAGTGDEVIGSFRQLSGNVPLMPLWALGYVHCRERFHTQAELLENAREFRKRKLPVDMFVQDWQYWGKYGWNAMKFDETLYPNPKAMVKELHDMNIRLMVSVWSKAEDSDFGKQLMKKGYVLPGTDWVDFFNPEAAAFYWQNLRDNMALPYGIDAWWLDATEPESEPLRNIKVNNGTIPGEVYRNIYPLFVNKTVYEGYRRDIPGKRVMSLTRSGFSGMQRYAVSTWSGDVNNDWATFRKQIVGGLGQMAAGLPWWTYDAGGFFRPENQYTDTTYHERFLRWFQVATFVPIQRVHGNKSETEFWRFGETVEQISRKYLDLRYRMLPYIYSQAAAISFHGATLMRPLVMDFPTDKQALEQNYEFMFGPALLIAPIVEPDVTQWSVYLPAHRAGWIDFWNGTHFKGGQTIVADVDWSKIPVFVKAGSILPLAPKSEYSAQRRDEAWEIRVYPGADASFTIYEDEGDNYNYEQGRYSAYELTWNDAAQTLTIGDRRGEFDGMTDARTLNIVKIAPQTGGVEEATPQQTVAYSGKQLTIELK
jgi:alpha-D-xyloside xylohydrolase